MWCSTTTCVERTFDCLLGAGDGHLLRKGAPTVSSTTIHSTPGARANRTHDRELHVDLQRRGQGRQE